MSAQKSMVVTSAVFAVLWIAAMAALAVLTSNGSLSAAAAVPLAIGGTIAGVIWYCLTKRGYTSVS